MTECKKLSWKEALEHAKQGKRIRKDYWKDTYVTLDMSTLLWRFCNGDEFVLCEDDTEIDWELYEDAEEKRTRSWRCCKEEPCNVPHKNFPIRKKTSLQVSWIGWFGLEGRLFINYIKIADPENYEYCELPE